MPLAVDPILVPVHGRSQNPSSPSLATSSEPLRSLQAPTLPRYVAVAPDQAAVERFFMDYVVHSPLSSPQQGFQDQLPNVYASMGSNSCLHHAVLAASLANLGERLQSPQLHSAARKAYCRALTLTNTALHTSVDATSDATLMAIFILGLHEVS